MKTLFRIYIEVTVGTFVLFLCSCQCCDKADRGNKEELQLLNPVLLSPERTHHAKLKLQKAAPESLTKEDIAEIVEIIGRVPGLKNYEILHIGWYNMEAWVQVQKYVVILEKTGRWEVISIAIPSP